MESVDPFLTLIFQIILYVIYRIIRAIVQVESDLLALLRKLNHNDVYPAEVFTILTRFRIDKNDIPRETDFMVFNESFTIFEDICNGRWHIYCITDRYVYFVRTPDEISGGILSSPYQTRWLFYNAEKIARIPIDNFIQMASDLAPLKSKILFLYCLPAVGGTLTAQLLQSADTSFKSLKVLGEPPVLTSLAILSTEISIEKMRAVTRGSLRFALLNSERGQTVIYKARSCCTKIVPYVHISYPSIQHVFVTTRDPMDCVQRLVEDNGPSFEIICRMITNLSSLADFFFGWRLSETEAIAKVGPTTPNEFALALIMGANINFQRNLKYFALDPIFFEDLLNDLHTVIRPLMDICDVSDLALHDCISFKRQEDTAFKRFSNLHSLSEEVQERLKYLIDLVQQEWNR